MLRSLRKPLYIGLFPGRCWLKYGSTLLASAPAPPQSDWPTLSMIARQMLGDPAVVRYKGRDVQVVLADHIASICAIPWQEKLHKENELREYARLCFEKAGRMLNQDWTLHAAFRQHGTLGLAYAIPSHVLESLEATAKECGMRLRTVLPLSGAAYFKTERPGKRITLLTMLTESQRVTSMVHNAGGMSGFDIEPVTGTVELAVIRQLRRLAAANGTVGQVRILTHDGKEDGALLSLVATELPEAQRQAIHIEVWA